MPLSRRHFLTSAGFIAAAGLSSCAQNQKAEPQAQANEEQPASNLFKISLAQWSLHRRFFDERANPLDFPRMAKTEFGIDGVEYVNVFFKDKAMDTGFLSDLKKRADDHGVTSVLIMCDDEGALGDPDEVKRNQAVENHYKWVEAARFLGCHSIRVNAESSGPYWEQVKLAADGLRKLAEFGAQHNIGVIVENHGGLSSNGTWLSTVMQMVQHPGCGTLPDFGNFEVKAKVEYDRYKGTEELMPFAKGVSAKSYDFKPNGDEKTIDFRKLISIVLAYEYSGWVGIEFEGETLNEPDGIRRTKKLLETIRAELS